MTQCHLTVPGLLLDLVGRGVWPASPMDGWHFEWAYPDPDENAESRTGRLNEYGPPKVPLERIRFIHPTARKLHLEPPPFLPSRQRSTISWGVGRIHPRFERYFAFDEIDRDRMIEIGSFEVGSDTPTILHYQHDLHCPTMRRLDMKKATALNAGQPGISDNHWMQIAASLDEFARLLGFL
jgi:hypothetical protein